MIGFATIRSKTNDTPTNKQITAFPTIGLVFETAKEHEQMLQLLNNLRTYPPINIKILDRYLRLTCADVVIESPIGLPETLPLYHMWRMRPPIWDIPTETKQPMYPPAMNVTLLAYEENLSPETEPVLLFAINIVAKKIINQDIHVYSFGQIDKNIAKNIWRTIIKEHIAKKEPEWASLG